MADYYSHWLTMGKAVDDAPLIFTVNWFRTNEKGEFAWPGFGDNARVLQWIIKRCEGQVAAHETALGWMPRYEDVDWSGLAYSKADFDAATKIDQAAWTSELAGVKEWFEKLGPKVPRKLALIRDLLEQSIQSS
jgi:phosphoenolpyruvate carboxykinase (GTP)